MSGDGAVVIRAAERRDAEGIRTVYNHYVNESTALFEARRCLSCGNCFGCDNCFGVCPDNAVLKVDDGGPMADGRPRAYAIDYDFCKGCGICAAECPCGAIAMVPEET